MTKENKEIIPIEEQPYAVPANWQWMRLKEITEKISDGSHNPPPNSHDGIPLLSAANIYNNRIDMSNVQRWITKEEYEQENKRTNIEPNDILLTIVGTLGRSAIVNQEKFALQRSVAVLKVKQYVKPIFLKLFLDTPYIQNFMLMHAKGTAQKGFYLKALEQLYCIVAPKEEQDRIIQFIYQQFSKLDKAKERIQSVLDSSETRKAAILHKAFTGELTASWRKENKEERFRDNVIFDSCIEKMQNGLSKRKGDEGEDRIVLRLINIQDTGIDLSDIRKIKLNKNEQEKYSLQKNDSIMIRVNGSKNNVGRQVLLTETINNLSFCDHLIRIQYKNNVLPKYMIYFSKTETYKRYVEKNMVSSAGQNTISRKGLKNLYVPVFTLEEQREIVRILDDLLTKEQHIVDIAAATLQRIDTMKQAILAKAFRGELGTNDPSEPPAPLTAKGDLSC